MDLTGRTAIVTGSSRGIGRAIALRLGELGSKVAVTFHEREIEASKVVAEIRAQGGSAKAYRLDVTDIDQVKEVADQIQSDVGDVDILVNSAGAILRPGDWNLLEGAQLQRTVSINLLGPINCIQVFAPGMLTRKWGRILNLTTTYAVNGAAPVLAYTAAKAGVTSLTRALAREFGSHGVTVNAVAPGNIDTDMTRSAGEGVIQWAISTTPLARLGTPQEVAEAAAFLLRSEFITGHVLVVDGGQYLNI